MSNWALVRSILDGWVWKTPGIHPAVPVVSLVLMSLSILMAIETLSAIFFSKGRMEPSLEIQEG